MAAALSLAQAQVLAHEGAQAPVKAPEQKPLSAHVKIEGLV